MGFEIGGLLLALAIQGPLTAKDSSCFNPPSPSDNFTTSDYQPTMMTDIVDELSAWERQKYFYISVILNFFFLAGFLLLVIFVNEDLGKFISKLLIFFSDHFK